MMIKLRRFLWEVRYHNVVFMLMCLPPMYVAAYMIEWEKKHPKP